MIDIFQIRCPRSSYPNHNQKKFDYSRDKNIQAYLNAASKIGINVTEIKNDKPAIQEIQRLIDKVLLSKTIHETTVYSDILWDGYNSYDTTVELIGQRIIIEKPEVKEKLVLLIRYLQMDKGLNRRAIVDKHYSEIMEDATYYKQVAEKAGHFIGMVTKAKPSWKFWKGGNGNK